MPVNTRPADCEVVELRQYTLHPGRRDVLIELFEREFVEPQKALGMSVMGQFRDLGDADRFVWLRGFADMRVRKAGLAAFYGGPVWREHRGAANATMIDSDDVRLLRPAWPGSGFAIDTRSRPATGATTGPGGVLHLAVFPLAGPAPPELVATCRHTLAPELDRAGASRQAWYLTDVTPNVGSRLEPWLAGAPETRRLAPTVRSAIRA